MRKLFDAFKWFGISSGAALGALALVNVFVAPATSDQLTIPNTFVAGTVANPSQVNANFDAVKSVVNGKIDNDNWDPVGPDLAYANMNLTESILTTDIKDGTIVAVDVGTSGLVASNIDVTINPVLGSVALGGTSDVAIPATETALATISTYTPQSANSIYMIYGEVMYFTQCNLPEATFIELTIYANGTLQKTTTINPAASDATDFEGNNHQMTIFAMISAPIAGSHDIELRHRRHTATCNAMTYKGGLQAGRLQLLELKND